MTENELHHLLKEFLSGIQPKNSEIALTEFHVDLLPCSGSLGGQFTFKNKEKAPVDLRKIGKHKCFELTERIRQFHRVSTMNGQNKWNKAFFEINNIGQVRSEFIWDDVWEQENIDDYNGNPELERQKWHWE